MALSAPQSRALALGVVAGAEFIVILDVASVNVALPDMAQDLELTDGQVSWAVNAYTLALGCLLLLGARMGDAFGTRRVFTRGIVLFASASLAGGLMADGVWLAGARALQGAGGALISPNALAIVSRLFPDGMARNRALAIWGAAGSAGAPAGALVGGLLTGSFGWSAVLFANVPTSGVILALTPWALPEVERSLSARTLDLTGAAAVTTGLALLIYGFVDASRAGWASARTLTIFAAAGILIGGFVVVERRTPFPLLPLGVLKSSSLAGACVVTAVGAMPVYGTSFAFSLYAQGPLDMSPLRAGLIFLPFGVAAIVTARGAAPLITRFGFKPVSVLALCLMTVGHAPLVGVNLQADFLERVLPALVLVGGGAGLFFVATSVAGLSAASHRDAAVTAGLVITSQQVGGAVGLALAVAVLETVGMTSGEVAGLRAAFGFDLAVATSAIFVATVAMSSRRSRLHACHARSASANAQG